MGRPIAMHLSLKGLLRTLEVNYEAYQSMISAVPQTAENNLSGTPGEIHHSCPNYQRWHTAPLLLQDNQRAGVQQFHVLLITYSTERILSKDAKSVKMLPQKSSIYVVREGQTPPLRKATVKKCTHYNSLYIQYPESLLG
ncbi:hypothetical protein J6590_065365 [Homalodisca vitripennis]|nr:hypothetical protein J6590_065365 [Homalodisca vitripennis]